MVNLNVVINEFANIGRADDVDVESVIDGLVSPAPPATFDMSRLRLITRRGSSMLRALPELAARVDDGRAHVEVADAARRLAAEWDLVRTAAVTAERAPQPPASQFVIAERLTLLFGAAACLTMYLANRDRGASDRGTADLWADDLWVRAVLARLLARLGLDSDAPRQVAELYTTAARRVAVGAPVTLLPGWWHEGGAHS